MKGQHIEYLISYIYFHKIIQLIHWYITKVTY